MPTTSETHTQKVTVHKVVSGAYSGNVNTTINRYTYTLGSSRTVPGSRPKAWAMNLIRKNQCATTSLTGDRNYLVTTPSFFGHYRVPVKISGRWYTTYAYMEGDGCMAGNPGLSQMTPPLPTSFSTTTADNQAKGKYMKAYIDAVGELQTLTVVGEGLKTIAQIARPGRALRNALNAWSRRAVYIAKRSRIKNGKLLKPKVRRVAVEKAIAGSYLEWVFGVKPLLMDLDAAARVIAESVTQSRDWSKDIRGVGKSHEETKTYSNANYSDGNNTVKYDIWKNGDVTVVYRGKVVLTPSRRLMMQRIGLRLNRFVPQVYELLPYSWLVDYFTNLGEVIDGLCTNTSYLNWTQKTVLVDGFSEARFVSHVVGTPSTVAQYITSPGSWEWHKQSVTRNQYFGTLTPSLQFRIPGSGTQWTNVAAVVASGRAAEQAISRLLR